jgi:predicted RNA-binding Zn ribbon-like protein
MSADFVFDGGGLATDFVNTRTSRWRGGEELLTSPDRLVDWFRRCGLRLDVERLTQVDLDDALELREAIDACILASVDGLPFPPAGVSVVNRVAAHVEVDVVQLDILDKRPVAVTRAPRHPGRAALAAVAADAVRMLGTEAAQSLKVCESDQCSIRFVDHSLARSRRWCSMSRCGNRAKARQFRLRHDSGAGASARASTPAARATAAPKRPRD